MPPREQLREGDHGDAIVGLGFDKGYITRNGRT